MHQSCYIQENKMAPVIRPGIKESQYIWALAPICELSIYKKFHHKDRNLLLTSNALHEEESTGDCE